MTLKRKVALNTVIQLVGKIISTILGLFAISMMTHYLGTTQYGWYVMAISFLQFCAILIDFGMTPVTNQLLADPKFNQEKMLQNLLGFRTSTAIIFLGIAPLIGLLLPYPTIVKQAILLMTIGFVTTAMNQILIGMYQTKLQMHIQVLGELIGRIFLVIGIFGLIHYEYGFLPMMGIVTFSSITYMLTLWIAGMRQTKLSFQFDKTYWKIIIQKSWPIALSIIFNVVYLRGDVVLLSFFRSADEVGLYGAAYRVLDVVAQTAMMIMGILMPLLAHSWSRNRMEEFYDRFKNSFIVMMMFGLPLTAGGMLLAKPIIVLIASEKFVQSAEPLAILSIAIFGIYFGALMGHTAVAIDKQKQTLWIYIVSAIITLVGYLYFLPRAGMIGAAWMTVFSEIFVAIMLYFTLKKHAHQLTIPVGITAKIIFATFVMVAVLRMLPEMHVIISILLGAMIYAILLLVTGAISKKLLTEIIGKKFSNS